MIDCLADLSHWNRGKPDFAAAKAAGTLAVALKASDGVADRDPAFEVRALSARNSGLFLGAYHFVSGGGAGRQCGNFLAAIEDIKPDFLALDLERGEGGTAEIAAAMLDGLPASPLLIYVGRWFDGLPNERLARLSLWLPEHGRAPVCPPGWASWTFWQYTSSGDFPGISGPVDRSRYAGTAAEFSAWARGQSA